MGVRQRRCRRVERHALSCTGACTELSAFTEFTIAGNDFITGLCSSAGGALYAVGTRGNERSVIYTRDTASSWLPTDLSRAHATACSVDAAGIVWVSAASGVIRFNGGATFESLFAEPYWLNSVLAIGGEVYVCGDRGMLYRRSATGTWFNLTPSPSTTVSLRVLNGTAVDRLFAAGSGLEASTWVWWAGERWVRAKTNSTSLERATIRTMLVLDDDTMLWGGHDDNIAPLIVRATRF